MRKIIGMVVLVLAAILAFAAAGLLGGRALAQNRNAEALAIRTPNGINEHAFVRLGGVEQWVVIRGEDRRNPVILVVGGAGADGPGTVFTPYFPVFRPWEKDYTVVLW